MTAEVDEVEMPGYVAYCDECDWEGETHLDKSDAEFEMKQHNKTCTNGEEPDKRTPRQKYQDELDALVERALEALGVSR